MFVAPNAYRAAGRSAAKGVGGIGSGPCARTWVEGQGPLRSGPKWWVLYASVRPWRVHVDRHDPNH
jgi:hypothetical protein